MAESRDDIDMVCRGPSWKSTWARPPLSADDIITGGREPQASPWPPLVEYQSYPMTDRLAVTPITRANRVREAIGDFLRRLRPGPRPAQVMLFGVGDSRFNPCVSLAGWHTNQRPEATPAQSSGQYAPLLRLLSEVRLESRAMRSPQSFETTLDVPQGVRVQLTLVDIGPTILAAAVQDASLAARLRPDDAVEVTGIAQDIRFLPLPPRSVDAIIATWTIEYAMKGIARDYSWPATAKEKAQLARKLLDALRPGAPGLLIDYLSVRDIVQALGATRCCTCGMGKRASSLLNPVGRPLDAPATFGPVRDLFESAGVGRFDIEVAQGPNRAASRAGKPPTLYRIWRLA